ncbi:MAG: hypothetical protein KME25_13810 [Symplocastrum torsivum CPER-KK1]|uniref:Uncharacterized protein n=1 Tax=Symplocastrum torsivum CPER-KK1 TaxID=450513 RepID=A0A951UA31_9CYAN|nr:hypothetical protein [Symplocastrum torsivum CPER-KK1]
MLFLLYLSCTTQLDALYQDAIAYHQYQDAQLSIALLLIVIGHSRPRSLPRQ